MKCKTCGCDRFCAHQMLRVNVIVDDTNTFIDNMPDGIEPNIYDHSEPYGPFECVRCGTEYDSPGTESDGSDWSITNYPYDDAKEHLVFVIDDPTHHTSYYLKLDKVATSDEPNLYRYQLLSSAIYRAFGKNTDQTCLRNGLITSTNKPVQIAMEIAESAPDYINADTYSIHQSSADDLS